MVGHTGPRWENPPRKPSDAIRDMDGKGVAGSPAVGGVNRGGSRTYWSSREALLVLPALGFYFLLYLYPLSRLLVWSLFDPELTAKNYQQLITDAVYFK